jgi:hypothetical protein
MIAISCLRRVRAAVAPTRRATAPLLPGEQREDHQSARRIDLNSRTGMSDALFFLIYRPWPGQSQAKALEQLAAAQERAREPSPAVNNANDLYVRAPLTIEDDIGG